jgi:hypothetical protein
MPLSRQETTILGVQQVLSEVEAECIDALKRWSRGLGDRALGDRLRRLHVLRVALGVEVARLRTEQALGWRVESG